MTDPVYITGNLDALERLFDRAPQTVAFHARVMTGRWFARHYREAKAALKPSLRKVFEWGGYVFWLDPGHGLKSDAQIRKAVEADPRLAIVGGRGIVQTRPAKVLERGATIRPRTAKSLAVPTGRYRNMRSGQRRRLIGTSPADWNARHPGQRLIPVKRKRGGGRVGFLAKPPKRGEVRNQNRLALAYVLLPQVTIRPQLGVVKAWDALEAYRNETLETAVARVVAELEGEVGKAPERRIPLR